MRVLFLSDTHLGLDLPAHPRVVRRRRGHDFFDSFERALEPARAGRVDVVIHGGDLHDRSVVPAWVAEAALAPLRHVASLGVPVLLLLGNHERSRLPCPLLAVHDGLYVFDRPRAVVIEARGVRAAFVGFPYLRQARHSFRRAWEEAAGDGLVADVRVLCMHQCVEGATCGPGDFVFRWGAEVVRVADLPPDVAVTLCGHVHRHQVLRPATRAPIVYAGSVERTSFAEMGETKGYVEIELTSRGLAGIEFHALPTRPMVSLTFSPRGLDDDGSVLEQVRWMIASTPVDAVVQLRVDGPVPRALTAAALRAMAGARNVGLSAPSFRRGAPRAGRRERSRRASPLDDAGDEVIEAGGGV